MNTSAALDVSGTVNVTGTITAGAFTGNGSGLTNLPVTFSDAVDSASSTTGASSKAVKSAYDKAAAALPLAGGMLTGNVGVGKPAATVAGGPSLDVSGSVNVSGTIKSLNDWFNTYFSTSRSSTGRLQYDTVQQDSSNSFTTGSTSQFVAPIAGIYFFSASVAYNTTINDFFITNSTTSKLICTSTRSPGHVNLAGILKCNVGDIVYTTCGSFTQDYNDPFSGCLLFTI